jgi:hypothetical protein
MAVYPPVYYAAWSIGPEGRVTASRRSGHEQGTGATLALLNTRFFVDANTSIQFARNQLFEVRQGLITVFAASLARLQHRTILTRARKVIAGDEFSGLELEYLVRPSPTLMSRLQQQHELIGKMAVADTAHSAIPRFRSSV